MLGRSPIAPQLRFLWCWKDGTRQVADCFIDYWRGQEWIDRRKCLIIVDPASLLQLWGSGLPIEVISSSGFGLAVVESCGTLRAWECEGRVEPLLLTGAESSSGKFCIWFAAQNSAEKFTHGIPPLHFGRVPRKPLLLVLDCPVLEIVHSLQDVFKI